MEEETDVGRLDGKVALITGAGRGIGRAIAQGFGQEGARLAINDIDSEQARATAGALRHQGVEAIAVPADVSRQRGPSRAWCDGRSASFPTSMSS